MKKTKRSRNVAIVILFLTIIIVFIAIWSINRYRVVNNFYSTIIHSFEGNVGSSHQTITLGNGDLICNKISHDEVLVSWRFGGELSSPNNQQFSMTGGDRGTKIIKKSDIIFFCIWSFFQ